MLEFVDIFIWTIKRINIYLLPFECRCTKKLAFSISKQLCTTVEHLFDFWSFHTTLKIKKEFLRIFIYKTCKSCAIIDPSKCIVIDEQMVIRQWFDNLHSFNDEVNIKLMKRLFSTDYGYRNKTRCSAG